MAVTPGDLLGRVDAVVKLASQGALPLDALAGGGLFSVFSPGAAFTVIAVVSLLATGILVLSGITRTRDLTATQPTTAAP
jgi:hypothetical protein